jgi:large subunit ribosomal protein L2
MSLKIYKPTTASSRHTVLVDKTGIRKNRPLKSLLTPQKSKGGRNFHGKVTMRHQGGGVKKQYRIIDFLRDKLGVPSVVESIEYDPNRSANIALLKYIDGERRYILAPEGIKVGDQVITGEKDIPIKPGNCLPLKSIPYGTMVHNVELVPGKGGQIGRSAGTTIQIMGGDKKYVQLKMPSGEIRLVREDCRATIGVVGNSDHSNVKLGKAGRSRKMGIRPTVRGVAMSSKHPHGGGQGKSGRHGPGGPSKDRWGNRVGTRTRKNKRTNKYIIQRVSKNKRKVKKYKTII